MPATSTTNSTTTRISRPVRPDRLDVFVKRVPRWKTAWKKCVLWLYEHDVISVWLALRLIRIARAELG